MLDPPIAPMLGRLARELPGEGHVYEPKWDGFRCLVFRDGDGVDLRSRHGRAFARYFPEIVDAVRAQPAERFVLDGEALAIAGRGLDFAALMLRLHPAASRVERLARETPAVLVAFDLLALGDEVLLESPFERRRSALAELVGPPLFLTPQTADRDEALAWRERFGGGGVDGVIARRLDAPYEPGVQRRLPGLVAPASARARVAGRVLVDWNQNAPRRSTAAAYSLRAAIPLGVSTPLVWEELSGPLDFRPADVVERLARLGDLWAGEPQGL